MQFTDLFSIYTGEIAALTAALLWAVASVIFDKAGKKIGSLELTLWKGIIAMLLLGATILIQGESFSVVSTSALFLLLLSGLIGIGIGDTAFFKSMEYLDVRKALLLGVLAPPLTAVLAAIFLSESLRWTAWIGIIITVAGVAWVITERTVSSEKATSSEEAFGISASSLRTGIFYGALSAVGQSVGAIFSRLVLTSTQISPLQTSFIRLFSGMVVVLIWMRIFKIKPGKWLKSADSKRIWGLLLAATFIGTYLALWLQQVSFKFAMVGIAQTLTATSPLFALPIALIMGEKVSFRSVFGVMLSLVGIWLLFC